MEEPRAVNVGIQTFCPTRWTVRTGAMQAKLHIINYKTLEMTMEEASRGTDDGTRRVSGVAALMEKFSAFFGLKISMILIVVGEKQRIVASAVMSTNRSSQVAW